MNVRVRLKLDQVRADIADLPDNATSAALRGLADLIELVLVEPDRQIDVANDPDTNDHADAFARRIRATVELLAFTGYKATRNGALCPATQRVDLDCGAKLTFFTSGKAIVQGKVDALAYSEITGLLRADGWAVK